MSSSKVVALGERLKPFVVLVGNVLVPSEAAALTEANHATVREIYRELLALENHETFQEEFLLNQIAIGARAVLSRYETHFGKADA